MPERSAADSAISLGARCWSYAPAVADTERKWSRARVYGGTFSALMVAAAITTISEPYRNPGPVAKAAEAATESVVSEPQRKCGVTPTGGSIGGEWGPPRPGFTLKEPPPGVAINSIRDSNSYGDERAFFDVRLETSTAGGSYCNSLQVRDGDILVLRVYAENGAPDASVGEDGDGDGDGVALGTTVRISADDEVASLRHLRADVQSINSEPPVVWDTVELAADGPFRLDFLKGSAMLYSNAFPGGASLDDSLWGASGGLIGSRGVDGRLGPGYSRDVVVQARVRVTFVRN